MQTCIVVPFYKQDLSNDEKFGIIINKTPETLTAIANNSLTVDEGTCGYGKNGKLGKKPAGPHLITKSDLKERIKTIIRKYQ